ncbi:hypothetical protein RGUI_1799 [Rhodovulum sp. P5]|uniref:gamma-glutamylcyclotransferase family protein n=1 Tax=Rhodovulum sp. P5 TaxID=1564506 RepID=UPI0009C32AF0|nr:gamma-glutamylcyclotransferase family protein [Rhodovulum sp. P5]ARE39940.1 hypothetical protein RGUI_1799 [Rhodovulum sp. P5]
MHDPFFFGYGSLVNRATHSFPHASRARITGWRRAWMHTKLRQRAFLSAVPAEGEVIEGLIAAVPGHDWAALDEREHAYDRHEVSHAVEHTVGHPVDIQIYAIPASHAEAPDIRHPILLSYIDVVVQGYLREFGPEGARRFFDTTDGWDAPILNDRAHPIYSRHQVLRGDERAFVDDALRRRDANLIERE